MFTALEGARTQIVTTATIKRSIAPSPCALHLLKYSATPLFSDDRTSNQRMPLNHIFFSTNMLASGSFVPASSWHSFICSLADRQCAGSDRISRKATAVEHQSPRKLDHYGSGQ